MDIVKTWKLINYAYPVHAGNTSIVNIITSFYTIKMYSDINKYYKAFLFCD